VKVVILNDYANANGGASQVALTEAIELARQGCAVTYFAAVGPVAAELAQSGAEVVLLGQQDIAGEENRLRAAMQGLWNVEAARRLDPVLRALDPADTIVHLHSWSKALSASVVRLALDRGFHVVCTLHDYFTACPNGGFYNYHAQHLCHLTPMSAACLRSHCDRQSYSHKLWRVVRHAIMQSRGALPRGIHGFLYSTELTLELLRPHLPAGACFRRLPNPIDVPQQPPADPGSHRSFTAVGRIVPEKGFELLARAAQSLGVPMTIIGDGYRRESIRAAAPDAIITGWLPRAQVLARLRESRALVFPSLWYETQGMAVWEAASQGIPAIVPDHCAAREGVEDGVTGYWFEGGNWESLADRMRLLADPARARRMGRAAYERYWADPMTAARHAQELMKTYAAVLAHSPQAQHEARFGRPARTHTAPLQRPVDRRAS
jgi:glycosyltransferase involved in cell wall biosynthesis